MPEKLPKGWVRATLNEISLPVQTHDPRNTPSTEYTYFDIGGIDNTINRIASTKHVFGNSAPSRARQVVKKGDILFSTVRTYLRKIALIEKEYPNPLASTGFAVIRPAEEIEPDFLLYQVISDPFLDRVNALQSGTSYPAVRSRDVLGQQILLAPTAEQKRIVRKLKAALSRIENGRAATTRALEQIGRYRDAVIDAGVTGRLTRKRRNRLKSPESAQRLLQRILVTRRARWEATELQRRGAVSGKRDSANRKLRYPEPTPCNKRELPALPKSWTWASPEQLSGGDRHSLSIGPFGSNLKVSDYRNSGIPVIFVRNIRRGSFAGDIKRFVNRKKAAELGAHQVSGGDILVAKMGDPPGDTCLYPENAPCAVITADCIRFHVSDLLYRTKQFFVYALNSSLGRQQILRITKGVAQQKVSLSRFSSIALPLPPLAEQTEIIQQANRRLAKIDQLEDKLRGQLVDADATRKILLRDAFTGRFVAHDEHDEPASALLERIRAASKVKIDKSPAQDMSKSKSNSEPVFYPLLDVLRKYKKPITPEKLFYAAGFKLSDVDMFYRELTSIRDQIEEHKPKGSEAKSWPKRAKVMLQVKSGV